MAKNSPPCTRGLPQFKKGCPERSWDGESGCPYWKEMSVPTRENPQQQIPKKQCIDLWMFEFSWALLGLLEGNQEAVERFRNAMCVSNPTDPLNDNKASPKPDPAMVRLVQLLEEEKKTREAVIEYKVRELLKGPKTI